MDRPFRILSLSGGGARGVLQARYLARLEAELKSPLAEHLDLIAGTSTGALVAVAIADGIPASRIFELYEAHSASIFRARALAPIRRGPRYRTSVLEERLRDLVGNHRMSDLNLPLVVPTSTVDTHRPKIFTPADSEVLLLDVALASAAAPTYFRPRRVSTDKRSFYDGGLWANDPAGVALSYARDTLGIDPRDVRMLMVGTGQVNGGSLASELDRLRPLSLQSLKVVSEMLISLQSAAVRGEIFGIVDEGSRLTIDPELPRRIALDDAKRSNLILPPVAEDVFEQSRKKAVALLTQSFTSAERGRRQEKTADPIAVRGIAEANLTTFIPERRFYTRFRDGHGSISEYIALATREIVLVSVNLMTGESFEGILETFQEMLSRPDRKLIATISLLDPREEHLLRAVSGSLNLKPEEIGRQIRELTEKARRFRQDLPAEARERFTVHWHESLPSASAILSDAREADGRIQLETKAYKSPTNKAFGFEVGAGSELYSTLRTSYYNLIRDGERIYIKHVPSIPQTTRIHKRCPDLL